MERLNRYLAQHELGSRRQCDELIKAGRVTVNDLPAECGMQVGSTDVVKFDGTILEPARALEYYLYHKAPGTIVTARDPEGRETIYDALRSEGLDADHLRYVGRLDQFSEGALILTNDGDMIHAVTHPRFHIKKSYLVKTTHKLTDDMIAQLVTDGVMSEGELLHAGAVRYKNSEGTDEWYEVDLYEGKNRQLRRLFEAVNRPVLRLKRIQFANIKLRELPRGAFRQLEEREVKGLKGKGYPTSQRGPEHRRFSR